MKLKVDSMVCGGCVHAVTKTVRFLDADATVNADVGTKIVEIDTGVDVSVVQAALEKVGFPSLVIAE